MRYSLFTCALLFGFFITTAKAQKQTLSVDHDLNHVNAKSPENIIRCYTMEMDEQRRNKHPELPSLQEEEHLFKEEIENYKKGKGQNMNKATLLTIPCIFHIITDGAGAENISAAQVQAQVDQLNIDFRNLAGSTDPAAADVEIEFCLAILDESDNLLPEQGINRVTDYGEGPFNTGFIDGTIKPGTIWNPDEYMNVWVADITGGILGYAQFPSNSGLGGLNANGGAAATDGVVHLYSTIGSVANPFPGGAPYNLGRTMTHEVGHWLGLRHIWGDANCGNDFCADTPQSQTSNFGCPNLTTCDGNQDMVENYMDYTNDACMDIFTADQKDRIRTVMDNCPRRALLPLSEKCGLPQPTISFVNTNGGTINEGENCDYVDIPVDLQISLPPTDDATVTFTLGGNTTATQGVDFDIIPASTIFLANVTNNQSFILRIYNDAILENSEIIELQIVVTTAGDAVASLVSGTYTLTILDANFVASNILYEDFESGGLGTFTTQGAATSDLFQNGNTANASSQFWIIEPSNATQFAYTNDDACDCDKSNDLLTSPIFSLAGLTGDVFLEFDHAFSAETYETAEVEINTGAGWNNLITLANASANNNNTLTTPWVVGNQTLLTPFIGSNNVQIRFIYNDGGNWAYGLAIDNIRVYSDAPIASNNLAGMDTQASCGPFTWIDGNTYTASNNTATYTIVGGGANGCDSLVTLDLTISNTVNGTDTQAACGTFTWIDGNTYTTSNNTATYTIDGGAANGCDSLVTLDLTISNTVNGTDTQAACGTFTWIDGNIYTTSNNTATFTVVGGAANGCDSLVTLDLTISNTVNGSDTQASCGPFTWIDGNTYTTSNNTATFTIVGGAANGCDSLVTLDLTISNAVNGTDQQAACESYTWIDGNTYSTSNNTATYTIVGGAANGCDSLVTLDLTISNTVNGTDQQAACESYTWIDGNTYTTSNNTATYTIIGGSVNGCDSIVTLDLTIYSNNSTIFTETFDSGTIAGANAPVLYGNGGSDFNPNYALSGTFFGWFNVQNGIGDVDIYEQNFTGLQIGCDVSVAVWMRSTIPVSDVTMTLSDDNGTILSVLDPILSGAWQLITISTTVTTSGLNFLVHFNSTGGNGLDVIMEDLTVTQSCGIDAVIAPVSNQCLNGNSFTFDGMNSLSSAGITSYIWDFGDNSPFINTPSAIYSYANSGTYDVNLNVSDGVCFDDTTIQVNVYTDPLIDNPSDVTSCDTYVLPSLSFGNYYSGSDGSGTLLNEGDIIDITQSVFVFEATNTVPSCSNENEFVVTINNTITTTDFETSCGPYTWIDGITYNESNTTAVYTYPNVSASGCDSVVFLNLTVYSPTVGTDVITSCTPVIWIDGNTYTSSNNTATFTLIGGASNGCDSTVNLDLTISSAVYGTDIQVACETFTWIDGINYTSNNNTATFTYPNGAVAGCDSIVTLDLTVNNSISYVDVHESCDNFTWIDGNTYSENNTSASFIYPGGAANGCDSIVYLSLIINNTSYGTDFQTSCNDFTWIDGNTYTSSNNTASYTFTGGSSTGCDSIVSLNLTIYNNVNFTDIQTACDSYTWIDGNTYTENNTTATYTYIGGTSNGCDSIVNLNLTINKLTSLSPGVDLSLCEGDVFTPNATGALYYSWNGGLVNGTAFTPQVGVNEYTVIGTDINNCNASASIFINTTSLPSLVLTSSDPICAGDPSGSISIDVSEGTPPYSIEWSNNENTFNLENIIAGLYDAIVTDDAGCQITIAETISNPLEPCYELPETFFYVPNTFTPDADEHNQNWFIILSGVDPLSYSLRIYNRWGEVIWESFDIDAKWDGTYRNLDVPEGTYTWQLEYRRLSEANKNTETGHINLLR